MIVFDKIFAFYEEFRAHKRDAVRAYYNKLVKAALLFSIVPVVILYVFVLYDRLSFVEGLAISIVVFLVNMFFSRPYIKDLSSLVYYVNQLSLGGNSEPPHLSLLGGAEELSKAVVNLHKSWGESSIQLEAAIAESSMLFDTIPDMLLMLDKDLNILRANNAAVNAFRHNIMVKNLKDLDPQHELLDAIKKVLKSGVGERVDVSFKTYNITKNYLVMVEKFPVRSIGGISSVLIMHDITDEKRRKQMLKDFVANASHEIRTPLTSVAGFIENLQHMEVEVGKEKENKKYRKKFLAIMSEQANRMSKLVNDLLSLSKAEMTESSELLEEVDITSLINEVRRGLKELADERKIKLILKRSKDLPLIIGNSDELKQVFTNLMSNAIKYSYQNTNVEIAISIADHFVKSANIPKNCKRILLISVKDRGEGIAEEHLPRITERFYRVDKLRSRKVGGTGLGLAISKHIIHRHKGDLLVESVLNEGSVFTVRLPINNT
jgi:two-component system phosphate regulon sensor histidine kinase PhoR